MPLSEAALLLIQNCPPRNLAGPPLPARVEAAERELEVTFPEEFRDFLLLFGGGLLETRYVLGIARAPSAPVDCWDIVERNHFFRASRAWAGIDEWLVIGIDNGNPYGYTRDPAHHGAIFVADRDVGYFGPVATDFNDFVLRECFAVPDLPPLPEFPEPEFPEYVPE